MGRPIVMQASTAPSQENTPAQPPQAAILMATPAANASLSTGRSDTTMSPQPCHPGRSAMRTPEDLAKNAEVIANEATTVALLNDDCVHAVAAWLRLEQISALASCCRSLSSTLREPLRSGLDTLRTLRAGVWETGHENATERDDPRTWTTVKMDHVYQLELSANGKAKLGETMFFESLSVGGSWGGYHTQHSSHEGTQRTGTWGVSAAGEVLLTLGGLKGSPYGRGASAVAFSVGRSNGLLCLRRKTQSSSQLVIGSVPLGTEYKRVRAKK